MAKLWVCMLVACATTSVLQSAEPLLPTVLECEQWNVAITEGRFEDRVYDESYLCPSTRELFLNHWAAYEKAGQVSVAYRMSNWLGLADEATRLRKLLLAEMKVSVVVKDDATVEADSAPLGRNFDSAEMRLTVFRLVLSYGARLVLKENADYPLTLTVREGLFKLDCLDKDGGVGSYFGAIGAEFSDPAELVNQLDRLLWRVSKQREEKHH